MVALGFDQVTIVDNFQLNKCRISKTNIKIFSLFSNVLFVLRKKLRKKLTVFLFLQREEGGGSLSMAEILHFLSFEQEKIEKLPNASLFYFHINKTRSLCTWGLSSLSSPSSYFALKLDLLKKN